MKEYDSDLPEPDSAQTEAAAVRYGFDGYGWKYADEGNGSDWYRRALEYDDAEPLYAHPPQPSETVSEGKIEVAVQRYDIYCDQDGMVHHEENDAGSWVLYDNVRAATPTAQKAVAEALKLAAARLQRLALEIPSTTPLRADAFEWADEALRALANGESQ